MLDDLITVAPLGQDNADKAETKRMSPGFLGIKEFLQEIFEGARGYIWTTAFESFATGENWHGSGGGPGLTGWEQRFPTMDADMFFAIGLMGEGETRRSNTGVVSQPLLIVDDVGTKVSRADWDALFAVGCPLPTARIETSPGNETWIWALDGDASDPVRWQDLALIRAWLIERKLTDEVMDPARYVRLPGGWNSKPKYRGADGLGAPPRVSLVDWRPPSVAGRVSVDELGAAIVGGGLAGWRTSPVPVRSAGARATLTAGQLAAGGGGALARTADLGKPDALLRLALEIGLSPRQVRAGVVEADCPNMAAHTTRAETGFAFLGDGLMQCQHASCQGQNTVSFREMMLDRLAGVLGSERLAGEWWALEQVRDAGGFDDVLEATTVADGMAAARAGRVQREEAAAAAQNHAALVASPFAPVTARVAAQIPPRQFLYGKSATAGFISFLVAPGGAGKSSLAMVEAVAMASGKELLEGEKPVRPLKVWMHNAEDDTDEMERRRVAVLLKYGLTHAHLNGNLFMTSGREMKLQLARTGRDGPELVPGVLDGLVERIKTEKIDVLILDPLGALHTLPENSNEAANLLLGGLREVAHRTKAAMVILHHTGKAAATDMDAAGAGASRGASAFVDGARFVRQMVTMSDKEALRYGIKDEDRKDYLRIENGKANLVRAEGGRWVRKVNVALRNGAGLWPLGDHVGVVERWTPPSGRGTTSDLALVQTAIGAAATPPRFDQRAEDWVGFLVAGALGLDIGPAGAAQKDRTAKQAAAHARVRALLDGWFEDGGLVRAKERDPSSRKEREVVLCGKPAFPFNSAQDALPDAPHDLALDLALDEDAENAGRAI